MHAQTVVIIGGAVLTLVGFILSASNLNYSLKILIVIILILVTSPTGSHAISRAAYKSKIEPWRGK